MNICIAAGLHALFKCIKFEVYANKIWLKVIYCSTIGLIVIKTLFYEKYKHVAKNHIFFYINRKDKSCDEWTISKAPSGY